MSTTTKHALPYPAGTDLPDVPTWMHDLAVALDGKIAVYDSGTLASRPVSTAGSPGKAGRLYRTTDETPNQIYLDYGTGWLNVTTLADGAVGTAKLADEAVTTVKLAVDSVDAGAIQAGAVGTSELAAGAVDAGKVAATLKPSGGAAGGTEALRAIGASAGQVVAGNDPRLTDGRGAAQLDRKTITADTASISATTEGAAVAVITGNSVTYDGTEVKVEFWCPQIVQSAAMTTTFVLLRDATVVGQWKVASGGGTINAPAPLLAYDTPPAGSHAYKVAAFVSTGNVVVKADVGGSGKLLPATLRVTKA